MSGSVRTLLGALLWVGLGGWIGALLLFGAVLAPAAFQVLPTPELAGQLVGRVLATLNLAGAALGVALGAVAVLLRRGVLTTLLPLALAALCLASHFGVSAVLSELPGGAPPDPESARRFSLLHRLSVAIFGATLAGSLLLAALHARADARERRPARG